MNKKLSCPACQARTLTSPYNSLGKWYARCNACRSIAILEPVMLENPDATVPPSWRPFAVVGVAIDTQS